ncbi:MAG: alpha-L-fucosidase, partial [Bryobacteraceae bacterium]
GFSYGYNRNETLADYHTGRQLLLMLIDIVSRGGNFLLDIGPRADGHIPVAMAERLSQIGDWLRPHGEAIYGTKAWDRSAQWSAGEMPHFEQKEFRAAYNITKMVDHPPPGYAHVEVFFASKDGAVYAIVPHRPKGDLVLRDFAASAQTHLTLLHPEHQLQWHARDRDLVVSLPDALPRQEAYVIKMSGVRSA